ncbi:MAG: hypothetical protein IPL73_28820 [Candidatus Obscuribacter sp.]|nr:hypothetical protein [Candidatus Obscuribacter sp.]
MSSDNEDLRLAQDEVPEPGDVPKSSNDSMQMALLKSAYFWCKDDLS